MDSQTTDVIYALRKKLEDFRERKPHLSVRAIAKHSQVNRYFLSKILHDEPETLSNLDFNQILLLTRFLSSTDTLRAKADHGGFEIQKTLLRAFDSDYESESDRNQNKKDLSEFLLDFDSFVITVMASNKNTSRCMIEKAIMPGSCYKIDRLIKDGVIFEGINGEVYTENHQLPGVPQRILLQHLPDLLRRYYTSENPGEEKRFLGLSHQNLNTCALKKFRKLCRDFVVEANALMDSQESQGDIPVFFSLCLSRFTDGFQETDTPAIAASETQELNPLTFP